MKLNQFNFTIITALGLFAIACQKTNCDALSKALILSAPIEVNEREDIQLSILNAPAKDGNTYYHWKFPDMLPYAQQSGYGVEVSDASPRVVKNANVRDEGAYTFTVDHSECGAFSTTKNIQVNILQSPCAAVLTSNTLVVVDDLTGFSKTSSFNISMLSSSTYDFHLTLMTSDLHSMAFRFEHVHETSSTFYLRNYYANASEDTVEYDDFYQSYAYFSTPTSGYNDYKLIPLADNIYLQRENNHITLSFCNVKFKNQYNQIRSVSGKLDFDL